MKKKKINFQILTGIAPRGTKLYILYDSNTESHFFVSCTSLVYECSLIQSAQLCKILNLFFKKVHFLLFQLKLVVIPRIWHLKGAEQSHSLPLSLLYP